jgi:hypothetical protein
MVGALYQGTTFSRAVRSKNLGLQPLPRRILHESSFPHPDLVRKSDTAGAFFRSLSSPCHDQMDAQGLKPSSFCTSGGTTKVMP